ncbi:uncharacterized protein [Macrobrachium rosenbergii]|uniref:uncharacterized protein n=1 Tax=Macrobrachium rosenbergii TaxID=79674 RepID=UPI0034D7B0FA
MMSPYFVSEETLEFWIMDVMVPVVTHLSAMYLAYLLSRFLCWKWIGIVCEGFQPYRENESDVYPDENEEEEEDDISDVILRSKLRLLLANSSFRNCSLEEAIAFLRPEVDKYLVVDGLVQESHEMTLLSLLDWAYSFDEGESEID